MRKERRNGRESSEGSLRGLLSAVGAGDERALHLLFRSTHGRIHAVAWSLLGERHLAEEVVVDTYLQIWRRAHDYDPERGSVGAWMETIARRRTIDRLRSRSAPPYATEEGRLADIHAREPSPLESSQHHEDALRLQSEIRRLPASERRCLQAAFEEGLSHAEIARALDQPLGTVKSRIRSALGRLRMRLGGSETP